MQNKEQMQSLVKGLEQLTQPDDVASIVAQTFDRTNHPNFHDRDEGFAVLLDFIALRLDHFPAHCVVQMVAAATKNLPYAGGDEQKAGDRFFGSQMELLARVPPQHKAGCLLALAGSVGELHMKHRALACKHAVNEARHIIKGPERDKVLDLVLAQLKYVSGPLRPGIEELVKDVRASAGP